MSARAWILASAALALTTPAATSAASVPAWTTYHHDGSRSGVDPDSGPPAAPTLAWQSAALDGPVYGEPLAYGSRVYVATENDTVYALDASTGAIVWHTHLAKAVDAARLKCGDITPTVGITSTPVIDPATGEIYVVADTWDGTQLTSIAHQLYALNLSDGSLASGPVTVDPPGSTPSDQLQRASLALDAGKVIIGFGGNSGDCGSYHGWLVAVPEGGGKLQMFEVDSAAGDSRGAIWGSGNAPAIDSAGDIWISTGNGNSSSFDYSESVIKLDSNLDPPLDWWAPSNWQTLDSSDKDLGSSMPLLLPDGLVFEIGKAGVGYLLSAAKLGSAVGAPAYQAQVCPGSWGGGIYQSGVIYVACSDGMHALALDSVAKRFSPLAGWTVPANAPSPPIVAGGLVWSADYGNGLLVGLDPATGAERFTANLGGFEHFTTPSAGGGLLFVANHDRDVPGVDQISAFSLAPVPPPGSPAPPPGSPAPPATSAESSPGPGTAQLSPGAGAAQPPALLAPTISGLRIRVVAGRMRLTLAVSEPATLTVTVSRLEAGRIRHRRCRLAARHGRRCQAALPALTLHLVARPGMNALRPRMRSLLPGRYVVIVSATDAAGRRATSRGVVAVPRRPRRG